MKKTILMMLVLMTAISLSAASKKKAVAELTFDASKATAGSITTPQGTTVNYKAYEGLFYVTNVEDSAYQTLNVYVPEGATQQSPIFLRTYVGGYMASKAQAPQAGDASCRALQEGYVVVIPGTRGRNSFITADKQYAKTHKGVKVGQKIYTGRAPKAILDLKAAIRYLRHFDKEMLGDAERIITDGTSAGGAMSALMGGTGNHSDYEPLLDKMGAAKERDDVFAAVCFCPITDLEHADMTYEWLYNVTNRGKRNISEAQKPVSDELTSLYPAYLNSLQLRKPDGTLLTADNYLDYVKELLIHSAQLAKNAGADIPDSIGFKFNQNQMRMGTMAPINGGVGPQAGPQQRMSMGGRGGMRKQQGEYIIDLDMPTYLNYVVSTQPLKSAPAFDSKGVADCNASGENEEFGDELGSSVNFTDFSAQKAGTTITDDIRENVRLMNPMNYIGDEETTVAPHWYIRHGARDRDTGFPVPVNLATKLQNIGKDVDFLLAWNRPHSGDYALDELFEWINKIVNESSAENMEKKASVVIENILTRASVRSYQDKPVEKEKIEQMLRAAMAAPSAADKRPWHFVVVTDRQQLDALAAANRNAGMARRAPLAIVVCGNTDKALGGDAHEMWIQDVSAATQNLLLTAHALGLGAVWTGTYPVQSRIDATRTALGLPANLQPLNTIVIGYPSEPVEPKDKWDPAVISYDRY